MSHRPARLRVLLLVLACLAGLGLTGCTGLPSTGDKGFVSGDGQIRTVDRADREEPVELTGEDLDGKPLDLAELRGSVVVLNVWGSWCGPCRREMPDIVAAAEATEGVARFVGINIRDHDVAQAQGFVRTQAMPFPSFHSPDGKALLAFSGTIPPSRIPSTVFLDEEGRVAAVILGEVPSVVTVTDLVEELAAEGGAAGSDGGGADG